MNILKDLRSKPLDNDFDKYYLKMDNSQFYRFRRLINLHGLRYKYFGENDRRYSIQIFDTKGRLTSLSFILKGHDEEEVSNTMFRMLVNYWKNFNESNNDDFTSLKYNIDDPKSLIIRDISVFMRMKYEEFLASEENRNKNMRKFGQSANDVLRSLGATDEEVNSYWLNIKQKEKITPLKYMGYLNLISNMNIPNELIYDCILTSKGLHDIGLNFLPNDKKITMSILKSYYLSRVDSECSELKHI